jgi:hypothetical protein
MNQFSNTQRSVTTDGYDELLWTSVSNKLPPISLIQAPEKKKILIFIELGNVHFILLTE